MVAPGTVVHNRYTILEEIGAGGMGAVYRARDMRLLSDVALKRMMVNRSSVNVRAFEREAQLLAQLKHPALPTVSDIFFENGDHFLVMEYIDGEDLASMIGHSPLGVAQVLDWCDTLLDALDYMHSQPSPVIHRDIKPQNLKISARGGIKLLDFGLAKGRINRDGDSSGNSMFGFTPNYSALEQMQNIGTDPRTDLFGLGATMFHLLTGKLPPQALDRLTAKAASGGVDPLPSIHRLNPLVPKAVSDVFSHALELSRDDRPNSAAEMRVALRSARGYPALPVPAPEQPPPAPRVRQRSFRPVAQVLVGMAAVLALLATVLVLLPLFIAAAQPVALLAAGIGVGGILLVLAAIRLRPPAPIKPRTVTTHAANVQSVAFSRDGQLLASAGGNTICVWHVGKARELFTCAGHRGDVRRLVFTPDSSVLVSVGDDGTVRLWSASDGEPVQVLRGHQGSVGCIAVSPDGTLLASAGDDCTVRLWRVADGKLIHTLREHTARVLNVAFSRDGQLLASAGDDAMVRVWNVANGMPVHTLAGHTDFVSDIQFSPDNQLLASGSGDTTVRLWRMSDGKPAHVLRGHTLRTGGVVFHPRGKLLASRSADATIQLWRVRDGSPMQTLKGHNHYVSGLAFAPDGKTMASVSWDKNVHIWRVNDGRLLQRLDGHTARIGALTYSSDGRWLATASMDHTVRLWNLRRS